MKNLNKIIFTLFLIFPVFVFADTVTNQDVTWSYRYTSDESSYHDTTKTISTPIDLAANSNSYSEYLNGFKTRTFYNFTKDFIYNLSYTLTMYYDIGNDGNFRSDTVSRLKDNAWVDSDFNIISSNVSQISYECTGGLCTRVFSITINFNCLNNTGAIRFGVFTANNISLGFYKHFVNVAAASYVHMLLSTSSNITESSAGAIINQNDTIINQNNQIINNQNSNTQSIINNQNQNNQAIINNQNQNTQDLIDDNKKNFQSCNTNLITSRSADTNHIWFNGTNSNTQYVFEPGEYTFFYNKTDPDITLYIRRNGSTQNVSLGKTNTVIFNSDTQFNIWLYKGNISLNTASDFTLVKGSYSGGAIPLGQEKCVNKIDATNNAINDVNSSLNDSSVDGSNTTDTIDNLSGDLPTNTVISDLLLLPVNMLQAIVNSIGGTCASFSLGSLYGTNLVMPCINLQQYLGSSIWTFIDLVFTGMFILVIRKKFIQIFQNITNLRTGGNEVE